MRLLNQGKYTAAVNALIARGLNNKAVISGMQYLSRVNGKPEMAEGYELLKREIDAAYTGYETGKEMKDEPEYSASSLAHGAVALTANNLDLLLSAAKIADGQYEYGLAVTAEEFGESGAYYLFLTNNVNALTDMTETQLKRLDEIRARLEKHVKALNTQKAKWQKRTGNTGEPVCQTQ